MAEPLQNRQHAQNPYDVNSRERGIERGLISGLENSPGSRYSEFGIPRLQFLTAAVGFIVGFYRSRSVSYGILSRLLIC